MKMSDESLPDASMTTSKMQIASIMVLCYNERKRGNMLA
jgi:hypothetical protein